MFYNNKKRDGFTLIELLVVIAIIGILSSVVLTSLGKARKKAKIAKVIITLKQIELAMQMALDDEEAASWWKKSHSSCTGSFVSNLIAGTVSLNGGGTFSTSFHKFMSTSPKNPFKMGASSREYCYMSYPNDSTTPLSNLPGSFNIKGPSILIYNITPDTAVMIDKKVDGEVNNRWGKIRYYGLTGSSASNQMIYQLSPNYDF